MHERVRSWVLKIDVKLKVFTDTKSFCVFQHTENKINPNIYQIVERKKLICVRACVYLRVFILYSWVHTFSMKIRILPFNDDDADDDDHWMIDKSRNSNVYLRILAPLKEC